MSTRTPRKLADAAIPVADLKIDTTGVVPKTDEENLDPLDSGDVAPAAAASAPAPEDVVAKLKKEIEEANALLAAEKARADRAEQAQASSRETAVSARAQALNSDYQKVESDIAVFTSELAQLEKEQAEAFDVGDNKKAVELGRKINRMENKLTGAEYALSEISKLKERAESTPTDAIIDISTLTKPAQEWAKKHPKFTSDITYYNKALAAHYAAIADGIKADSPEYFEFIDKSVAHLEGSRSAPVKFENDVDVTERLPEQTARAAGNTDEPAFDGVPPSRNVGTEANGQWLDNSTYRPTAEEIEAAEICGYVDKDGNADVARYIRAKYPERFKR